MVIARELPSNLPNVFRILWDSARVGSVEVKPMDEKLSIQGEVNLFVLYEAEGEEGIMQWYETTVPFSGIIDCRDCKESCVADLTLKLCMKNRGKCRGIGHMKPEHEGMRILQICHSEGNVKVDEIRVVENGLAVDGVVEVQILYITVDDKVPFYNA